MDSCRRVVPPTTMIEERTDAVSVRVAGETDHSSRSCPAERAYLFSAVMSRMFGMIRMPLYEKEHDPKKHEKHMCRLVEAGTTLSEYSRLAFKGVYVCKECGRVANAEESLCEPVDMRKIRF